MYDTFLAGEARSCPRDMLAIDKSNTNLITTGEMRKCLIHLTPNAHPGLSPLQKLLPCTPTFLVDGRYILDRVTSHDMLYLGMILVCQTDEI